MTTVLRKGDVVFFYLAGVIYRGRFVDADGAVFGFRADVQRGDHLHKFHADEEYLSWCRGNFRAFTATVAARALATELPETAPIKLRDAVTALDDTLTLWHVKCVHVMKDGFMVNGIGRLLFADEGVKWCRGWYGDPVATLKVVSGVNAI